MKKLMKVALAFVLAIMSGRAVVVAEAKASVDNGPEMTELQKLLAEKGSLEKPGNSTNAVRCN
jgi:hypothetical protein